MSNGVPIVKLTLASRVNEIATFATVTFKMDGLRKLAQGGWVSVNNVSLLVAPLRKQGFWYRADVPKSSTYTIKYLLATGGAVIQHVVSDRPFFPTLPSVVSRSRGLIILFRGSPLLPSETLSVDIGDPVDGPGRWSEELQATVQGNKLIISSAELARIRLGPSILSVSVFVHGAFPVDNFSFHQGNTDEIAVNVID